MIDSTDIRHEAILRPQFVKCETYRQTRKHADVKLADGSVQCIDCGTIKRPREAKRWHTQPKNK